MIDITYLAGYFDGEGFISIQRWEGQKRPNGNITTSYQLHVGITNTYRPLLSKLKGQFGGYFGTRKPPKQFPNARPLYDWRIGGPEARAFLTLLLPHLIEKKEQAELALQLPYHKNYQKGFADRSRPPEVKALQEHIYQRVLELKSIHY